MVSTISIDSLYFLMVGLCFAFFLNISAAQWQDTSSCDYGESKCSGYDGYICEDGSTCIYCGALLYNYDCDACDCTIGSLAFWLCLVGGILLLVGCIVCCVKAPCCSCCCCNTAKKNGV